MPSSIRKVQFTAFGPPSNVVVVDDTLPDPPKDHVQIKVLYSGFSGSDINMRLGVYPLQKKAPLTPGYCLVGHIHANGPNSTKFQPGTLVVVLTKYDSQATFANVPEKYLVPVPEGVNPKAATAMVLDWTTAYGMVDRAAKISADDVVFIHGLSGAVGYALLALCKLRGATKIYGTASARNHKALEELGARPFVYTDKKWIDEMRSLGGATAVFDPLGFESWDESYSILSTTTSSILVGYGGNAASLPNASSSDTANFKGRSPIWPTTKLLARNLTLCKRSTSFFYIDKDQKTFLPDLETLLSIVQKGQVDVKIKKVIDGLDNVRAAHEEWSSMKGIGSVVVKIGEE